MLNTLCNQPQGSKHLLAPPKKVFWCGFHGFWTLGLEMLKVSAAAGFIACLQAVASCLVKFKKHTRAGGFTS